MLAAIRAQVPFRINGREVTVGKGMTTVRLHGEPIATVSFQDRTVTLNGDTPVYRKSARVFNTILHEYTSYSMRSVGGQWVIAGLPQGPEPVGTRDITLHFDLKAKESEFVPNLE